jgi:hypothetical protein
MQIIYCETCGVRVPEEDLQSGAAFREGPQRAHCAKCSQTQRPTKTLTRPPTRENAILSRATKPATGAARPVAPRSSGESAPTAPNSNMLWIAIGVGTGVFGLLLILYAARGKPPAKEESPMPPVVAPTVAPENATPPPTTVKLDDKPAAKNTQPETVSLVKPATQTLTEAKPEAGIDDIRENFAKRKWTALKAQVEKSGGSSGRANVRNFATTYATTAAGKEAAEYLKKIAPNEPPLPGANIFASYGHDFKSSTPKTGWRYLWNPETAIGESAKYAPLVWNETKNQYCGDAKEYPGGPSAWAQLKRTGGHPGQGTDQSVKQDRFVIAAYTLQVGQSGKSSVAGVLHRTATSSGTVELRIYVNDSLKTETSTGGTTGAPLDFNTELGQLNPGDTVYVCVGPNKGDGSDSFNLEYSIFPLP